jgi:hypothetical protein
MTSQHDPRSDGPPKAPFNWDKLTAIMAVMIGALALGVSWYTASLQNAQVKAQTWPYLQLWNSTAALSLSISNRGVGPAQIRDVRLTVDGRDVSSFGEAFEALSGRKLECAQQSYFSRRVLAANEDVTMIQFCNQADFDVFATAGPRLVRMVCYCSLLDQCTLIDESAEDAALYQRSVDACPVGVAGSFR